MICLNDMTKCNITYDQAIQVDDVESLRMIYKSGTVLPHNIMYDAASFGSVNCLRFLKKKGFRWDSLTSKIAASNGLECLKVVPPGNDREVAMTLAYRGDIRALDFMFRKCGLTPHYSILNEAAASPSERRLDCARYLIEKKCVPEDSSCSVAAAAGNEDCLSLFHSHGVNLNKAHQYEASSNGRLSVLKYFHKNGYTFDVDVIGAAFRFHHIGCIDFFYSIKAVVESPSNHVVDNIALLRYAFVMSGFHPQTLSGTISSGDMKCMEFVYNNSSDLSLSEDMILSSIYCSNVEAAKFLVSKKCPFDLETCRYASLRSVNDNKVLKEFGDVLGFTV